MNLDECIICLENKVEKINDKKGICLRCSSCIICNDCIIKSMEEGIFNKKCFTCNLEFPWCTFHQQAINNQKKNYYNKYKQEIKLRIKVFFTFTFFLISTGLIGYGITCLLNLNNERLKK